MCVIFTNQAMLRIFIHFINHHSVT
jgi:hypothetical protein